MGPRSSLKQEIQRSFRLHGYQMGVDGCKYLTDLLSDLEPSEWLTWIAKMIDVLQRKELPSNVLDRTVLERVVQDCSSEESGEDADQIFNVIDAFDVPRLSFSIDRKKFLPEANFNVAKPNVYPDAESKARLYRERYMALFQRTSRHKLFTPSVVVGSMPEASEADKKYQLKTIDYLLGTPGKLSNVIVLGALCQLKTNKYSLEDPTGLVDLDLTEAKFHRGLYTENCYVLVEGWYEDMLFHVVAMGHPPVEKAEGSRCVFGTLNYFGGPLEMGPKASNQLLKAEEADDSAMIVFVSDLWLDKPDVVAKFNQLLAGYASMPPTAFVLMGNFTSSIQNSGTSHQSLQLKDLLTQLGETIAEYQELRSKSKFIFVPGPQDPGFPLVFPRPALPNFMTEDLRKKVPNAIFTSNPCRIQYCTQEIVIFREDIVTKMCRNCVYFPESGDIPEHFARTVLSQGHLAPLPLHIVPTYWDHDRSLWLYPVPDLVVIGDKFDPFIATQDGCSIVNPGSFGKNDFSFKTYVLKTRQVEDSQIPNDED